MSIEPYSPAPGQTLCPIHIHIPYSSPVSIHLLFGVLVLFPFISPNSSHTSKMQWEPFHFTEDSLLESKKYLPPLRFNPWLFLLLPLALSLKLVQVWPVDFNSCAISDWVWLIRPRLQGHIESVRRMLSWISSTFHRYGSE